MRKQILWLLVFVLLGTLVSACNLGMPEPTLTAPLTVEPSMTLEPTVTNSPSPTETPEPTVTLSLTVQPAAASALSPKLQTYLDHALGLIQENSIYAGNADWATICSMAYQSAANAQNTAELYPVLEFVLHATGDRHGYVMPPADLDTYFGEPAPDSFPTPKQELLKNRIGYLSVPTFASGNMDTAVEFAGQLQDSIKSLDAQHPCGWVLDLRGNGGGNGFAMLLGVSPLLEQGTLGWYTYNGGKIKEWRTQGSQIFLGDTLIMELAEPAYQINRTGSPVAILTNEITTSGGELVAVAFRGWSYTRSFGQRTWGLTTAPEGFFLEDGTVLGISVAYFTDHTGQIYQGKILPEQPISAHDNPIMRDDSVPQLVIDWLLGQTTCIGQ